MLILLTGLLQGIGAIILIVFLLLMDRWARNYNQGQAERYLPIAPQRAEPRVFPPLETPVSSENEEFRSRYEEFYARRASSQPAATPACSQLTPAMQDAIDALAFMGYRKREAEARVKATVTADPSLTDAQDIILAASKAT